MSTRRLHTELLAQAGRLLLEYNDSTGAIHRTLTATAKALNDAGCHVAVSYNGVAVSMDGEGPLFMPVDELRYNNAVLARVHGILRQLRNREMEPATALAHLERVEAATPRHSRWLVALLLGSAAASLAVLLGADAGAAAVAGLATALGLLARQELGVRHVNLLALPLTAALIGAMLGGLAIQLGWTQTPGLVLIVPALMLIPGPHLLNGFMDLIDNYVPMGVARLGLASGILLASALGLMLGIALTLPDLPERGSPAADHLNLILDMILAGIVTCGFAVFYNTPWRMVAMAALGGIAGHGLRFVALEIGASLEAATFLGGLAVGIVSAWIARAGRTTVAAIAFAGAVTMIPGLQIYTALSGAVRLARQGSDLTSTPMTEAIGSGLQACLVVSGLTLGLILGSRAVQALAGLFDSAKLPTKACSQLHEPDSPAN